MRSQAAYRVRAITAADVDAWAALRSKLWPEFDAAQMRQEAVEHLARVSSLVTVAYLAESEGALPLGFIELSLRAFSDGCESMPVPHVEGWYVEPEARGKGTGRALMRAAEEWCAQRGYNEIASDTEIDNEESLRAHERCGFQEVERLIKLRKQLRSAQ